MRIEKNYNEKIREYEVQQEKLKWAEKRIKELQLKYEERASFREPWNRVMNRSNKTVGVNYPPFKITPKEFVVGEDGWLLKNPQKTHIERDSVKVWYDRYRKDSQYGGEIFDELLESQRDFISYEFRKYVSKKNENS